MRVECERCTAHRENPVQPCPVCGWFGHRAPTSGLVLTAVSVAALDALEAALLIALHENGLAPLTREALERGRQALDDERRFGRAQTTPGVRV